MLKDKIKNKMAKSSKNASKKSKRVVVASKPLEKPNLDYIKVYQEPKLVKQRYKSNWPEIMNVENKNKTQIVNSKRKNQVAKIYHQQKYSTVKIEGKFATSFTNSDDFMNTQAMSKHHTMNSMTDCTDSKISIPKPMNKKLPSFTNVDKMQYKMQIHQNKRRSDILEHIEPDNKWCNFCISQKVENSKVVPVFKICLKPSSSETSN